MFTVKIFVVFVLTGTFINGATSMNHILRSLRTCSTQIPHFPEFVLVNVVDGLPFYYYDSKTRRSVPKVEWMNRMTEDDPQFWERCTQLDLGDEQQLKSLIEPVRESLNQTEGLHVLQWRVGCEWNDETDEIGGFSQFAFNGEDYISLDWDTQTFIAAKPEATALKLKWERIGEGARHKNQLIHYCVVWMKKIVGFGEKTLQRKELPLVSFLQKSSSSPVTCHATGFYPDRAMLFWTKDGEELDEEDLGEILANHDGTFQSSVSLDLTSVPTEDWGRYSCVFQLSGVPDDLITKLEPKLIRTNEKKYTPYIAAAASVLGAVLCAVIGFFVYRKYKAKQLTPQSSEPEVMQELNPQPPVTH